MYVIVPYWPRPDQKNDVEYNSLNESTAMRLKDGKRLAASCRQVRIRYGVGHSGLWKFQPASAEPDPAFLFVPWALR